MLFYFLQIGHRYPTNITASSGMVKNSNQEKYIIFVFFEFKVHSYNICQIMRQVRFLFQSFGLNNYIYVQFFAKSKIFSSLFPCNCYIGENVQYFVAGVVKNKKYSNIFRIFMFVEIIILALLVRIFLAEQRNFIRAVIVVFYSK